MWYTFFVVLLFLFLAKFSLHLTLQLKVLKSQILPSSHQKHFRSLLVTNHSPASSDDSRLLFKTTEEVTVSLTVAAETSMDAAVAEVLPELGDIFFPTISEKGGTARMDLLGQENVFSLLQTGFSESLNTIVVRRGF